MALQFAETWKSGEGTVGKDSADAYSVFVWGNPSPTIDDADNEVTATLFVIPKFAFLSKFGNIASSLTRERIAPGWWLMTMTYHHPVADWQTNDAAFSFSTGGGTLHITCARHHVADYPSTLFKDANGNVLPAPNHNGLINFHDGQADGIDIHLPTFDFKTTFYLPPAQTSTSYMRLLYTLTAHVNSDPVTINIDGVNIVFNSGELLFMGADGAKRRGFSDWELSLSWSGSPNEQNVPIGFESNPVIVVAHKNGWDYVWVEYGQGTDAGGAQSLVGVPRAAHVEQLYDYKALTPLLQQSSFGLGNTQPWLGIQPVAGGGIVP